MALTESNYYLIEGPEAGGSQLFVVAAKALSC